MVRANIIYFQCCGSVRFFGFMLDCGSAFGLFRIWHRSLKGSSDSWSLKGPVTFPAIKFIFESYEQGGLKRPVLRSILSIIGRIWCNYRTQNYECRKCSRSFSSYYCKTAPGPDPKHCLFEYIYLGKYIGIDIGTIFYENFIHSHRDVYFGKRGIAPARNCTDILKMY